ncbi:MAG: biotin transporter BioY [Dehalococcoidia bacterium]|jgi:biotin transport system substrate-specific component|nr:biotin transporter BioY [Dehalococcoidia bacterium]MDP7239600.1 biotin transporter BioY [Dehalococcoidia bacterium]
MAVASYLERYRYRRYSLFRWRYKLGVSQKLGLALALAAVTGLVAQLRVPLPFTPVPITGQVFAVLLTGVLLGRWYGGLSMGLYAAIGGAGVGWFAGWNGGLSSLTGATGGYILGFVVAAFAIGWLTDRYVSVRSFFPLLVLMLIGVGIIYLFGAVWLSIVLGTSLTKTLSLAVLPFIPLDLAKAAAVAGVAYALLPKAAYNGEVDSVRYLGRRF